jgi:putative YhbY family RNA-binding protein
MTELNPTQRRALRAIAHHLNPVVSISQKGLTPAVLAEIDRCLKAHELIKIRLYGIARDTRPALFDEICHSLDCAQVQHIGNLLVLWRKNPVDDNVEKSALATRRPRKIGTKKQEAARNDLIKSKRRKT